MRIQKKHNHETVRARVAEKTDSNSVRHGQEM